MSLLARSSWRHFARHPAQLALAVLGVAIGVAVVLAMDLAIASADRAFELTTESLAGRATHRITAENGIDEALYRQIRVDLGLRHAAPSVSGAVSVEVDGGFRTATLLGVDPFAEASARPWLGFASEENSTQLEVEALLVESGAVVATPESSFRLGLRRGDRFRLQTQGITRTARLVGLLAPRDAAVARGLATVLIADLSTAQEMLARIGKIDAIDLRLEENSEATLRSVHELLGPTATVELAGARRGALRDLTRAFRINLQALSLLALLVGGFLIFNAVQFAVVQRRSTIGILRAVGSTRRQILAMVLREALVLGTTGTVLGLLIGPWMSYALVGLITRTINDFYFTLAVTEIALPASGFAKALALGLMVGLVAALSPALEATRVPPREAMAQSLLEGRFRRRLPRMVAWSGGLTALGAALLMLPSRAILLAYAGIFSIMLAAACLVPALCVFLLGLARPTLRLLFGAPGSQAARGASATLSRTAAATAALMLAVAASVGLGMMIASFRGSVSTWLHTVLRADVYVTVPAALSARNQAHIAPELASRLATTDGIAASFTYQRYSVQARVAGHDVGDIQMVALQTGPEILGSFDLLPGSRELSSALALRGGTMISEPLAYRLGLSVGDELELRSGSAWRRMHVAAVFRDFGSERGVAMIDRDATHRAWWDQRGDAVSSMALFAAAGVDADELVTRFERFAAEFGQSLSIRSNAALRNASLGVFDRTFAITGALRLLCLLVAFLGIWSSLMALQLDRRREVGILRALGALPRQIATLVLAQTGLLGLCAGVIAIPVGTTLGWLLVTVVNRRSFGWTLMETHLPAAVVVEALGLACAAALLAGAYPALRFARTATVDALREEG